MAIPLNQCDRIPNLLMLSVDLIIAISAMTLEYLPPAEP